MQFRPWRDCFDGDAIAETSANDGGRQKQREKAAQSRVLSDYDDTTRVLQRVHPRDESSGVRGLASRCEWPRGRGVWQKCSPAAGRLAGWQAGRLQSISHHFSGRTNPARMESASPRRGNFRGRDHPTEPVRPPLGARVACARAAVHHVSPLWHTPKSPSPAPINRPLRPSSQLT